MKPTLFLLAAGMGSRYGGLKQLDGLGPNGETIMDYSIYDAINAGRLHMSGRPYKTMGYKPCGNDGS